MQNILLIVDKTDITGFMLSGMLENLGLQIINTADEKEAIRLLKDSAPCIKAVLWVVNSSRPEELEPVMELKRNSLCGNIPVIILSEFMGKTQISDAGENGIYTLLDKPCDDLYIKGKICEVLGIVNTDTFVKEDDIMVFNFPEMLNKEIKSAARGSYPLAIILVAFYRRSPVKENPGLESELTDLVKQVIKKSLRDTDTVFRYGAGRFILLLPFTDRAGIHYVEKKVAEALETHSTIGTILKEYNFCTAAVCFPEDGKVSGRLLESLEKRCASPTDNRA